MLLEIFAEVGMDDIIEINDQFYILATSTRADEHSRVLKHNDMFAVFDQYGDIQPLGLGEEGLYFEGTRFLSSCKLTLNGRQPLFLSSTVVEDNSLLTVDLTNPDLKAEGDPSITRSRGRRRCTSCEVAFCGVRRAT